MTPPRLRILGVVALGVFSLTLTLLQLFEVFFVPQTTFGIDVDDQTLLVNVDDPSLAKAGFRDGDQLDVARMSYDDRVKVFAGDWDLPINWTAGTAVSVSVRNPRFGSRTIELHAIPRSPWPLEFRIGLWTYSLIAVLWVLIGVVAVVMQPSGMTWGFYLFCLALHPYSNTGEYLGPPWIAASLIVGLCILRALGYAGIISFAARFPRGNAEGGWKYFELAALPVFLSLVVIYFYDWLPELIGTPVRDATLLNESIVYPLLAAVLVALFVKLRGLRGRERASMAWVVVGFVGCIASMVTWNGFWDTVLYRTPALIASLRYALIAIYAVGLASFPLCVAYAIVWHRAFGMGFITNRVLVYGFFASTIGVLFGIVDWLVSAELTYRNFGFGFALGAAFAAGLLVPSQYRQAIRLVDRFLLPERYAARVALDRIREAVRSGTRRTGDRLALDVAEALGLASVAVFARTSDGGFMREVSCGWSEGVVWHVLPHDDLCRKLTGGRGFVRLTESDARDIALPAAAARPQIAIAVRRGGRIERAILVGSRRSGTALDGDVLRGLAALFAETAA